MKHIITYEGLCKVSLGVMLEDYVPLYLPWVNKRIGIEGTLLRPPYTEQAGREWVRSFSGLNGSQEVFAVLLHGKQRKKMPYRYVGHMGIHDINLRNGFATTGSVIGDPRGRTGGCGTEAKLLLMYHAFKVLGLRKLISGAKYWNGASMGHLIKCGYKVVGRYHRHHLHEGKHIDECLLEVFREDWEPIWQQYQETKQLPKLTLEQRELVKKETSS